MQRTDADSIAYQGPAVDWRNVEVHAWEMTLLDVVRQEVEQREDRGIGHQLTEPLQHALPASEVRTPVVHNGNLPPLVGCGHAGCRREAVAGHLSVHKPGSTLDEFSRKANSDCNSTTLQELHGRQ
jgi:hypothetical protein